LEDGRQEDDVEFGGQDDVVTVGRRRLHGPGWKWVKRSLCGWLAAWRNEGRGGDLCGSWLDVTVRSLGWAELSWALGSDGPALSWAVRDRAGQGRAALGKDGRVGMGRV
jgi:hypothetical protein